MKRLIIALAFLFTVSTAFTNPVREYSKDNWVYKLKLNVDGVTNYYWSSGYPADGIMVIEVQNTPVSYDRVMTVWTRTSGGQLGTIKTRVHYIPVYANTGNFVSFLYGFTAANSYIYSVIGTY